MALCTGCRSNSAGGFRIALEENGWQIVQPQLLIDRVVPTINIIKNAFQRIKF